MKSRAFRIGLAATLVISLWAVPSRGQASRQERIVELEKRLASASEVEKVGVLNDLALLVVRRDGARAKELATEALALAEKLGDNKGQAFAHKNLGLALMVLEKPNDGLIEMRRANELYIALGDRVGEASTLGYMGMMLSGTGKLWEATSATEKALAIYTELKDTSGMAAASNNLAVRYTSLGEMEKALRWGLEALRLEESLNRKNGIANNLNSIGNIYLVIEDYKKAREYYEKARPLYEELNDTIGVGKVQNNIGITYEKLDQDDEALRYHELAMAAGQKAKNRGLEAEGRHNMAVVLKKKKRYDEAIRQYLQVLATKKEIGDRASIPGIYHNLGEVALLQNQYREALEYLEKAKNTCLELKSTDTLDAIYRTTAQVYEAMGNWKKAYENEVLFSDARAAILDSERNQKMAELQEKYNAEANARKIELLGKDNELLKKDAEIRRLALSRTQLVVGLLIAITALVVGTTLLLFRRYLYLLAFWKKRSFVGGYRIEQEITSGGMGVIYRATSLVEPSRVVALKVIREELAGDEKQRQRFINEGRIIDSLDHPGIVKVFDRGEHAGRLYIAMELLEGKTLAALITDATVAGRPIELKRCLDLFSQLVDAMVAIHARGVIHRDISPANVIVVEGEGGERAKLLDFGLAKADTMTTLTEVGELLGTLSYLAPERIQLRDLTPASDTFSLGAMAYELLTLSRPFAAEEPAEVLRQLLTRAPVEPGLLRPELGGELSILIMTMLAKEPTSRPGDEELQHRLTRVRMEAR